MSEIKTLKANVVNTMKTWLSMRDAPESPDPYELLEAEAKKVDPISFIIYILCILTGLDVVKRLTIRFFKTQAPAFNEQAATGLKKSSISLLSNQTAEGDMTLSIPLKRIDPEGRYKTDPSTLEGAKVYPEGDTPTNFDRVMYKVAALGEVHVYQGITMSSDGKTLTMVMPNGSTFTEILLGFISVTFYFDPKILIRKVLELLFGLFKGRSKDAQDQQIRFKMYMNLIGGRDNPTQLTEDDIRSAYFDAQKQLSGLRELDLGCGVFETDTTDEDIDTLIEDIMGGDENNGIKKMDTFFDSTIRLGTDFQQNEQAARLNFFKGLLEIIKLMLIDMVMSAPQTRLYFILLDYFRKRKLSKEPASDAEYIQENAAALECVGSEQIRTFADFLMDFLKKEIKKLLRTVIRKLLKKMLKKRIDQLLSLLKPF